MNKDLISKDKIYLVCKLVREDNFYSASKKRNFNNIISQVLNDIDGFINKLKKRKSKLKMSKNKFVGSKLAKDFYEKHKHKADLSNDTPICEYFNIGFGEAEDIVDESNVEIKEIMDRSNVNNPEVNHWIDVFYKLIKSQLRNK